MEISKPLVGAVAALCLVAGAGAAYVLRPDPPAGVPESTVSAGVEASEALVTTPPAPEPSAPVTTSPAATRTTGERRSTPSSAPRSSNPVATAAPAASSAAESARAAEPRESFPAPQPAFEPIAAAEPAPFVPPAPLFEELVVSADAVIGLEVETSLSSERAHVEDAVVAEVARDVKVGSRVAIPSGAKAHGEVTLVERGGRLKDRARLGVRFTSIVLADGTRVPIETDVIVREGSSPGGESSAKIGGGALGGAIIGGILGGAKGAIIGGSVGAGAGTGAVLAGGRNAATLSSGTPVTVRLLRPTTVTVEK